MTDSITRQRLDKWLWAARFYKTRALAVEAINGGKVHLNQQRVKPGRNIQSGDILTISRAPYQYHITIIALATRRGPAPEAQQLYQESDDSIAQREFMRHQIKNQLLGAPITHARPNKRERRHIIQFNRR